jgi:hypothetical protein
LDVVGHGRNCTEECEEGWQGRGKNGDSGIVRTTSKCECEIPRWARQDSVFGGFLEVVGEVREGGEFEEDLAGWGLVDYLMLEDPGEVVGDEYGVEASGEGGVDVRAGAVADHPGGGGLAGVVLGEAEVGVGVLFGEDLDGGEVVGQAGAVELVLLLDGVAFGDEDDAVAGGEVGEGMGDAWEEFDLLVGDGLSEVMDALVLLGGEGAVGKLLEAGDEGLAEAVEAVALRLDGGVLNAIEVTANLLVGVDAVVEVGDEGGDGALEVDVVLPEGVIGIDEEGLGVVAPSVMVVSHEDDYRWFGGSKGLRWRFRVGGLGC